MNQSFIAALTFWSAFVFSIGPFWIATMDAARGTSFPRLYRHYLIYTLLGWLPVNFIIGFTVRTLGKLNEDLFTALYFVGAGVIFWLAYKVIAKTSASNGGFDFNWKTMCLISWTNPKVWLTIPPGYLAANFTDNTIANILIFFWIGFPLFLIGVYVWGMIGRQGARIAKGKIAYFNAALLGGFGLYLLYQGVMLISDS